MSSQSEVESIQAKLTLVREELGEIRGTLSTLHNDADELCTRMAKKYDKSLRSALVDIEEKESQVLLDLVDKLAEEMALKQTLRRERVPSLSSTGANSAPWQERTLSATARLMQSVHSGGAPNAYNMGALTETQLSALAPSGADAGISLVHALGTWSIKREDLDFRESSASLIGRGTFGKVYLGKCRGKEVAVKKLLHQSLDQGTVASFKKEVATMTSLLHPNILLLLGACFEPKNFCLVTEYMGKGSVRKLLQKKEMSFKRKMLAARDTAQAMSWLHAKELIHLDLKTDNLLVADNWTVKVADFGLTDIKKETSTGGIIGTPMYAAPEMLLSKPYTEKADVYSFGVVLWELITEKVDQAYTKPSIETVDELKIEVGEKGRRPRLPRGLPSKLKKLLLSCWEADPAARPSFDDILKTHIFESLLIDYLIFKGTKGRRYWEKYFVPGPHQPNLKLMIGWEEFQKTLAEYLRIDFKTVPHNDIKWVFVRELVASNDQNMVSVENFNRLLCWFGPLDKEMMWRVYDLLSQPWFYGSMDRKRAEETLISVKKDKAWFVRFSSAPGSFAITQRLAVRDGKVIINHYKVDHKPGGKYVIENAGGHSKQEYDHLQDIVKAKNDFPEKRLIQGSPYQHILLRWQQENEDKLTVVDNYSTC